MKKELFFGVLTVLLMFGFAACSGPVNPPEDKDNGELPIAIPADADEMAGWLHSNAEDGKTYAIKISGTQTIDPQNLDFGARSVTVVIEGTGTLEASGQGSLFSVESGTVLILDGVTLRGVEDNNIALVAVENGGALIMNSGKITGNKNSGAGGGVSVRGIFIMNGGEISENEAGDGAGVLISDNGNFTMTNGVISHNDTRNINPAGCGAGVRMQRNASFTMAGGTISNNRTYQGGGILIGNSSSFIMKGGKITNNHASVVTASNTMSIGGGIFMRVNASFVMIGGEISGNTAAFGGGGVFMHKTDPNISGGPPVNNANFIMSGGSIFGNIAPRGGGVFIEGLNFIKSGGTISGNTASGGDTNGHAVFYDIAPSLYRDDPLDTGDNISTADTVTNWSRQY